MTRSFLLTRMLAGSALVAASVWAQTLSAQPADPAPVARGLIVELKPATPNPNQQTAQTVHDRLASMASRLRLPTPDANPRRVGANGYLMRFNTPLRGAALAAAVQNAAADPSVQSVSPDVLMRRLDVPADLESPDDPLGGGIAPNPPPVPNPGGNQTAAIFPNDLDFANGDQWYLRAPDDPAGGASALNLPPVWDITASRPGQVIAVLDSGALFNHEDLASQFVAGYDFITNVATGNIGIGRNPDASDPGDWFSAADLNNPALIAAGCQASDVSNSSWHGSFIAGIIGAASNNGIGVTGLDWNVKILPVRVLGKCGAYLSDVVDGLRWAAGISVAGVPANPTPARIINISLGSDEFCSPAYQSAINDATARGTLVVVAAGNSNAALGNPASCTGVLTVGAVRRDGLKTFYSSFGARTGLMAPGGAAENTLPSDWITSTSNTGTTGPVRDSYRQSAGTSFAAPMAAGVASLMLDVNPGLKPAQLIAMMRQSARPFPSNPDYPTCGKGITTACNCTPQTCGAGLLDANAAEQLALAAIPGSSPNPAGGDSGGGATNPGSGPGGTQESDPLSSDGSNSSGSQGGGGATGWLWGLGLWSLAAAALWQRRRKTAAQAYPGSCSDRAKPGEVCHWWH